jgi:hypothetical protein
MSGRRGCPLLCVNVVLTNGWIEVKAVVGQGFPFLQLLQQVHVINCLSSQNTTTTTPQPWPLPE